MDYKWIISITLPILTTFLGAILGIFSSYFINKARLYTEEIKEKRRLERKTYNEFAKWYGQLEYEICDNNEQELVVEYSEARNILYSNFDCLDEKVQKCIIEMDNEYKKNPPEDLNKLLIVLVKYIGEKMNYPFDYIQ